MAQAQVKLLPMALGGIVLLTLFAAYISSSIIGQESAVVVRGGNSPRQNLASHEALRKKKDGRVRVYHNWKVFQEDYRQMLREFRVYVYPDAFDAAKPFANVFVPHSNPYNRKLGNYFSEHMFKVNLLSSGFLTRDPSEAHLFFLPFSINVMRYDARIQKVASISQFVADYVDEVRKKYEFWNRTQGADHFYSTCHSIGREAASRSQDLQNNAIQVTCSASYYQKFYVPHKDIALPQVWPRPNAIYVNPPSKRTNLAFYAGRTQNSRTRQQLVKLWSKDPDMRIYDGSVNGSYVEALSTSKFCLHVKGYEVNTARISDAIHYGCVPVIISNHYDLPLSNIINWKSFSIVVPTINIPRLKSILERVTDGEYKRLHSGVAEVKKHFGWHNSPRQYDSFHMTMYQLWLRRHLLRPPLA